jgi:hypothetical protein
MARRLQVVYVGAAYVQLPLIQDDHRVKVKGRWVTRTKVVSTCKTTTTWTQTEAPNPDYQALLAAATLEYQPPPYSTGSCT